MKIAVFSDLHNSFDGLRDALRFAQRRQADRVVNLGDVGHDARLFAALHQEGVICAFGNWEVSGYHRLPEPWAGRVAGWPALHRQDSVAFTHATPAVPPQAQTTAQAAAHILGGLQWGELFPRLDRDEAARWEALAAMETDNLRMVFHGHTHVQMLWSYGAHAGGPARWQAHAEPGVYTVALHAQARYLVGVGSAGAPLDGPARRLALYDSQAQTIELAALPTGRRSDSP